MHKHFLFNPFHEKRLTFGSMGLLTEHLTTLVRFESKL